MAQLLRDEPLRSLGGPPEPEDGPFRPASLPPGAREPYWQRIYAVIAFLLYEDGTAP